MNVCILIVVGETVNSPASMNQYYCSGVGSLLEQQRCHDMALTKTAVAVLIAKVLTQEGRLRVCKLAAQRAVLYYYI